MSTLQFISLMLVANIALMLYTILKTRKLPFQKDTKVLIYVIAVVAPVIGFILYWIKSRQLNKA
jgi:uncharacterized membrane protein